MTSNCGHTYHPVLVKLVSKCFANESLDLIWSVQEYRLLFQRWLNCLALKSKNIKLKLTHHQ